MLRDVRLAIRRFRSRPAYTISIVLIVGIGIGAATAVFSVVDQTILRPPPFAHADRLVQVMDRFQSGARSTNLTLDKIAGWQKQLALFDGFEGYTSRQVDLTGEGIEPERVAALVVTTGLMRLLGVQPSLGRGFSDDDGRAGSERVVLMSEGLWKRRFGGRPDVPGMRIALSDEPHTVIGIMPRRFRVHGENEDLWLPIHLTAGSSPGVPSRFVGLARLARGVDPSSRQALADTLAVRMQQHTPLPADPFWNIHIERKKVAWVADTTRTALFVLLGAVGFVLLITCANTASLFLTQVGSRQREAAIRAAIGATRGRLFREVLVESGLLACLGGAVGILLAVWGVDAIVAAAPPNLASNATSPIEVDLRILAIAGVMTIATGVLFGLTPAFRGSSPNVQTLLKTAAGNGRGRMTQGAFHGALIVAEVAFSLILLVGAALMVRTFANLHALPPGFEPDGAISVNLSLPTDKYVGAGSRSAFFESLSERVAALPGVSRVASAAQVFGGSGISFVTVEEIEGRDRAAAGGSISVPTNTVTAGYFQAMGIPLVAGRTFNDVDDPGAVVISRSLARRLWPVGEAVGRGFRFASGWPWYTVIGVAGDVEARIQGDVESVLHLYTRFPRPSGDAGDPPRTRGYSGRVLIVRANDPAAIVPGIRGAVWALDRNQPVGRVDLIADLYRDSFARERFVLQLMGAFALIAVVLTAAGIFGVLSQVVAGRTREIGVRVALGARAADIVRLVASRGVALVAVGTLLGLGGALALTRFLGALLFQVRPADPASFATVTMMMIVVAFVACWLPTRRALRVDPAVALRVE